VCIVKSELGDRLIWLSSVLRALHLNAQWAEWNLPLALQLSWHDSHAMPLAVAHRHPPGATAGTAGWSDGPLRVGGGADRGRAEGQENQMCNCLAWRADYKARNVSSREFNS